MCQGSEGNSKCYPNVIVNHRAEIENYFTEEWITRCSFYKRMFSNGSIHPRILVA